MSHDSKQSPNATIGGSVTTPETPEVTPPGDGDGSASTGATATRDRCRILLYNWRDVRHPDAGGAEVFTHEVLKRLVDRGHEATLFAAAFDGCDQTTDIDGVEVVRAGGRYTVYGQAMRHYRDVRGDFDVVIDEVNGPPFLTPTYVDEPVVALIHHVLREEWFYELPFPVDSLSYHLQDWWLKLYRSVPTVTVSQSTERELRDLGFEDVTVAPEGIGVEPLSAVPAKPDRPTFLFVGRMARPKRPDHALGAFEHLRDHYPDARLHMVGDGDMLPALRANAGDGVRFHGYVSEERKRQLMKESHVLLVPSVREGWGLVVTEANAMGTPAVGYNVKGLRDSIRNGENGLLAAQHPSRLARRAVTVLETRYDAYTRAALEVSERHDWDRTTDVLEQRLLEVVG